MPNFFLAPLFTNPKSLTANISRINQLDNSFKWRTSPDLRGHGGCFPKGQESIHDTNLASRG